MLKLSVTAFLTIAGCYPATSSAQDSTILQTCQKAAAGVTVKLRYCLIEEFKKQDKLLNQLYGQVLPSLPTPVSDKLRKTQRAWVGLRDADCAVLAGAEGGGTLGSLLVDQCTLDRTGERILFLQKIKAINGQ